MKLLIKVLLTVFIAVFLYSCSDTMVNTNITPSGPFTLSGKIENWMYSSNANLIAEVWDTNRFYVTLDSGIVSADSTFTIKLRNVHDSLLYPIIIYPEPDTSCLTNVIVNPPAAKSSYLVGLIFRNDSIQGSISRSNYDPGGIIIQGQFFVNYLYLDRSVTMTGSVICNKAPFYDTTIYNFSGTRGWNKMVVFFESFTQYTAKVTISTTEPAGGKWWVNPVWTGNAPSDNSFLRERIFRLNNSCIHCR